MKKTKFKRTGNPVIDCNNAYEAGYKTGAAQAVDYGFQTGLYLALAGYYNTKPDDIISDEDFGKWSTEAEIECGRIFSSIRGDYDLSKKAIIVDKTAETLEDNVHYGLIKLSDLREKLGMSRL